ncbi:MAG: tetratricopeptide repeat protein, partial [Flavobacteriales bacterium]|nr:tetratricopeptide repeat protein [Flavobacteriales bacterium]
NAGNAAFGEKDFDKAVAMYGQAQRIAQAFGQVDTNAVYNTALAYESAGNTAEALKAYRQVLDLGYDKVEVYRFMAQLQARQEDWDGAVATVREGRAKHPEDADLLKDELVYLLRAGRGNESEGVLTEALKKNPNDPILLSIQGSQYEEKLGAAEDQATKDELFGKAEGAYKAAIEADPEFFDAYFNIGVLYNNRAADMYEQCNSIKSDKEYMACK